MRKFFGIMFYVISGFFLYTVCILAFINEPPVLQKLSIMGIFFIPALITLIIGLAITRFVNWQRDIGILMLSSAGVTAFLVFTIACLFLDANFKKLFPENKLYFFSDYISGIGCIIIYCIIGTISIMKTKKSSEHVSTADN